MSEPSPLSQGGDTSPSDAEAEAEQASWAFEVTSLFQEQPRTASHLVQAFFGFFGSSQSRRRPSDDVLKTLIESENDSNVRRHRWQMVALSLGCVIILGAFGTLLLLVYMVRDHVEMVKAVFEGVAIVMSHGAVGTGCFLAGRATKRPSNDA